MNQAPSTLTPRNVYNTLSEILHSGHESFGITTVNESGKDVYYSITDVIPGGSAKTDDGFIRPLSALPAYEIAETNGVDDTGEYPDWCNTNSKRYLLFKNLTGSVFVAKLHGNEGEFDDPDDKAFYRNISEATIVNPTIEDLTALNGIVSAIRGIFKI